MVRFAGPGLTQGRRTQSLALFWLAVRTLPFWVRSVLRVLRRLKRFGELLLLIKFQIQLPKGPKHGFVPAALQSYSSATGCVLLRSLRSSQPAERSG